LRKTEYESNALRFESKRFSFLAGDSLENADMNLAIRAFVSICCRVILTLAGAKVCPENLEPLMYWSLPLFHVFFHPLASGPSPQACACALLLNVILVSGVIFMLLTWMRRTRNKQTPSHL
jgi:hypothetical protein